jgi:hypothetical protein
LLAAGSGISGKREDRSGGSCTAIATGCTLIDVRILRKDTEFRLALWFLALSVWLVPRHDMIPGKGEAPV